MAEAGLMPQRPWHSRQSDGEVMDGADDCDEQKGFFPEWTVFVRGGNVTDLQYFLSPFRNRFSEKSPMCSS